MCDDLYINMFGEFSISYGDVKITDKINRSKKIWSLLKYILAYRERDISQNEFFEVLWPDDEADDPANTLKTLVHRARAVLQKLGCEDAKGLIISRSGSYGWNPDVTCGIDTEAFEKLYNDVYALHLSEDERLERFKAMIDIYKGDFLSKDSLEPWVVPLNTYYHSRYVRVVSDAAQILLDKGRYEELCELCQRALIIEPYDEKLHGFLLQGFHKLKQPKQVVTHYHYVEDLFIARLGEAPSETLTAIYKDAIGKTASAEVDLATVVADLSEWNNNPGSYCCDYSTFSNFYRIEARTSARTGEVVYLVLLTVAPTKKTKNNEGIVTQAMNAMKDTLFSTLRQGDVFTRYNLMQFLILLPMTNFALGNMIMERILKVHYKQNPLLPVKFKYSLQAVSPFKPKANVK